MLKVRLSFLSTILKYWRDLFSLEILKNERVTSPTHDNALGGWYIYRQPTIVVFLVGLFRQPLLKFSRAGNYGQLLSFFLLLVPVRKIVRNQNTEFS